MKLGRFKNFDHFFYSDIYENTEKNLFPISVLGPHCRKKEPLIKNGPGWICTRDLGHTGPHEACAHSGPYSRVGEAECLARWFDISEEDFQLVMFEDV